VSAISAEVRQVPMKQAPQGLGRVVLVPVPVLKA